MRNKLIATRLFAIVFICVFTITSCKKDEAKPIEKEETQNRDRELYQMAKLTSGFVWFKNSSSFLNKSSGSGHSQPFLRTRYNSTAAAKLDSTGKIMDSAMFPEGSLIVKELYDNTSKLERYAILYKNKVSEYADANGWEWGYMNSDGSVVEPASKKGSSCISCHSQANNIDYMLMNKYFP